MKRYKFLRLVKGKIKSENGDPPCYWKIGEWKRCDEDLFMCSSGFHCSKKILDALNWVAGEVLAMVEVKGKSIIDYDKECWSGMRIIKAFKWTKKDSVALAIFSAELVLKNYEKMYPDDDRPRKAIEAAKKVLKNDTAKNRSAAESAAESAWSAAWLAGSAARSAAESAAWLAGSARSAAESAAWLAAESARSAAESAAWSAAMSAGSAALNKINKWLINHIKELEEIKGK
jgi:hypothetical protein